MIAHLNKAPGADPYLRINGSTALLQRGRSVLTVTRDPAEDAHRLVAHHKSNYGAARAGRALAGRDRSRCRPRAARSIVVRLVFVEVADDVSREDVLAPGRRPGEARRGAPVPRGGARRRRVARLGRAEEPRRRAADLGADAEAGGARARGRARAARIPVDDLVATAAAAGQPLSQIVARPDNPVRTGGVGPIRIPVRPR